MAELPAVDQCAVRDAFVPIEDPVLGRFAAPRTPFRVFAAPPAAGGRAPALGADTDFVQQEWTPRQRDPDGLATAARAPLAGIRVVDLSMGWAGPLAARHLADLGAEVVKVEACQRFDWWRGWDATPEMIAANLHEQSAAFNMVNRNKLGITLDLAVAEGRALLLRLVALADVVVENYSGSVLESLGLDYDDLAAARPDLVMVSMPAFGTDGDWRSDRAYGSTIAQASGLPHLNGHPDWPPTMRHVALGDAIAGVNGAAGALTALRHRRVTGAGQRVGLSQAECLFPLAAHGVVAQSLHGAAPARTGSRREEVCPSGVFRCAGDDAWVVVQVQDDVQWRALCELIAADGLESLDLDARRAREDEIEALLTRWTSGRSAIAAMYALQSVGVAAGAALSAAELLHDPQLQARGFWQIRTRAFVGPSPNPAPPYRFGDAPLEIVRPAPTRRTRGPRILRAIATCGRSHSVRSLALPSTSPPQ